MLEIFAPYLSVISFIVVIGVNVALLLTKSPGVGYIVANIIVLIVLPILGFTPYDFIGQILRLIFEPLGNWIASWFGGGTSSSSVIRALFF
jgi:hypothetical protein